MWDCFQALTKRDEAACKQQDLRDAHNGLEEECEGFKRRIQNMDDVLKAKKSDVTHLTNISRDAQRAREQAKQDLLKVPH